MTRTKIKKFVKPKKCKQTGKSKFSTEKIAARAMFRIWSHDTKADIYDLHTYLCESCGTWHIGHKSYYQMQLAKESMNGNNLSATSKA